MSAEAERWREVDVKRALAAEVQEAGDALLAALEATVADRDRWVKVATGTAAMLEARDRRIAEVLEARDRRIAEVLDRWEAAYPEDVFPPVVQAWVGHDGSLIVPQASREQVAAAMARHVVVCLRRDLLAGRAAEGEG